MNAFVFILMIVFAVCFGVFFALWYRKREEYIELHGSYKATCKDRSYYYELANTRLKTNDDLSRKIQELKKRLNAMPMQLHDVTRIETYTPQMKVLKHSVELCPSDFGDMPEEQVIEFAKDELYKNMFETIRPYIFVFETNDIYHMRTTISGKIIVEDRGGKE